MLREKGQSEILVVVIIIFFLAVGLLIAAFVNDQFKGIITDSALNNTNVSTTIVEALDKVSTTTIQRGFVAMFAILSIGILISSFLIRIHPIWIFIWIIILAVTIFLALFLGNIYQDLTEITTLSNIASQQTMTNYIMKHIVKIVLAIGAMSLVVTFSKIFTPGGFKQVSERL